MNRLWVRLSLAFVAVAVVSVGMILLLGYLINTPNVQRLLFVWEPRREDNTVQHLITYYEENQSWGGVEVVLQEEERRLPRGPVGGLGYVMADASGMVIYDPHTSTKGTLWDEARLRAATPIVVGGQVRSYLDVTRIDTPAPENQPAFVLRLLAGVMTLVALVGGVIGVLFGVIMSRSLTAPLRRLAEAAREIGKGRLARRVETRGSREIVEVATAFNDMAAALDEAETLRRNMVADVAHELRTPLTVLQGNLRAILDDVYPLDKEEMSRLYDQTLLLHRLIEDLYELAQAEARQLSLLLRPVEPGLLLAGVVEAFAPLAEAKGVTLRVEAAEPLPQVVMDAQRISQAAQNLLSNALRHTPQGGEILLRAGIEGQHLRLDVVDNGEGVAAEHLPHLFDRLYRTDKARHRDSGGAGLGLAIVRALVEMHGGQVAAHSAGPGQGATFTLRLPLVAPEVLPHQAAPPPLPVPDQITSR